MRLRIREPSVWKGSCLNVFDGESGDRLVTSSPRFHRGEERFPGMTITFALIQIVGKIAEEIITKALCDGVDYELWRVFDGCVEFCREKRSF